jgi:hypothetical protein
MPSTRPQARSSQSTFFLRIGPTGEEFRGEIFPFAVRELAYFKTAAALHHTKEDSLFICREIGPDEQLKVLPAKTPVELLELFEAFVPMEDRIDGFQSPILVENDAAAEKLWPVKDYAFVVQEIESLSCSAQEEVERMEREAGQRGKIDELMVAGEALCQVLLWDIGKGLV